MGVKLAHSLAKLVNLKHSMTFAQRLIEDRSGILDELREGPLQIVCFLQQRFEDSDSIPNDKVFQFVYKHYYGLRFVSPEFTNRYFEIMAENKGEEPSFLDIAVKLSGIGKEDGRLQLVFVSKLCATVNPKLPICDNLVVSFYELCDVKGCKDRIEKFKGNLRCIGERAKEMAENEGIRAIIKEARGSCPMATEERIPDLRMVDLMIWAHQKRVKRPAKTG